MTLYGWQGIKIQLSIPYTHDLSIHNLSAHNLSTPEVLTSHPSILTIYKLVSSALTTLPYHLCFTPTLLFEHHTMPLKKKSFPFTLY